MSFRIPAAFLVISLLVFSACSSTKTGAGGKQADYEKKEQNTPSSDSLHKQTAGGPTAIRENSSIITGEIVDKKTLGENDFELMVMVKATTDTLNYESLIVKDMVYQMKPAFLEENGKIQPLEKNRKLLELKNLPKGSTFRARVSLREANKCIIQEVLDK